MEEGQFNSRFKLQTFGFFVPWGNPPWPFCGSLLSGDMTIPKNAFATSWGRELWVASLFTHCVIVSNCPLENNKNNNLTLRYLALTKADLLNKSLGQLSARGHLHSNEPRDRRGTNEEIRGPGNHKRDVCNYLGSEEKNRVHTRLICSTTREGLWAADKRLRLKRETRNIATISLFFCCTTTTVLYSYLWPVSRHLMVGRD